MTRIFALAALLFASQCDSAAPATTDAGPGDSLHDGGAASDGSVNGVCAGPNTPDVQGTSFSCEILVGAGPCTYCPQGTGATYDGGAADVWTVYPGECTCP